MNATAHAPDEFTFARSPMVNGFSRDDIEKVDPKTRSLLERRERVLGAPYRLFYRNPLHAVRGSGTLLYDADGLDYLDAYNNVPAVGHSNPRVRAAVDAQLGQLNTHTRYLTDGIVEYAERLTSKFPAPLTQAIFACTGSEAVDLALRIVRHVTGGEGIIITRNAYHGTTRAAAEVSPSLGAGNRIPPTVHLVDAPDPVRQPDGAVAETQFLASVDVAIERFRAAGIPFAGMVVDSVLSSDGLRLTPTGYLAAAAERVHAAGGLYIADEVQPGFGRTGDWWGFERHGFVPDLVVLGKPMGNGMPISAVVGTEALFTSFGRDVRYFNTFGGNLVSIAAAAAVLSEIEDRSLLEHVDTVGSELLEGVRSIAADDITRRGESRIVDVRGAGLFLAVEFAFPGSAAEPDPAAALSLVNMLRERRILVSASGTYENVLKIRPPLVFSRPDCARFLDGFSAAMRELD